MKVCLTCKGKLKRQINVYCSNSCQLQKQYEDYVVKWLRGDEKGYCNGKTASMSKHIYRYLHETRGSACEKCGWDLKHPVDGNILTEIDHIDGDAHNCSLENLRILCPNCHSMTHTFRNRNVKSKRIRK
jgi:predicted HNH restriction endonuclease